MAQLGGDARVSVLKAVVTQASAAIPVMPLYLGLLFKVMKEEGTHEGCIEQIDLLFRESLCGNTPRLDGEGRLRADYKEIEPHVQRKVEALWAQITDENLNDISDMQGYKEEFLRLFGFGIDGVDYDADVSPIADIEALASI
jgi:enoyl-[acyl-carrier protein] reductase/trans-2-enoyl-CoA reductase (NAD+)